MRVETKIEAEFFPTERRKKIRGNSTCELGKILLRYVNIPLSITEHLWEYSKNPKKFDIVSPPSYSANIINAIRSIGLIYILRGNRDREFSDQLIIIPSIQVKIKFLLLHFPSH